MRNVVIDREVQDGDIEVFQKWVMGTRVEHSADPLIEAGDPNRIMLRGTFTLGQLTLLVGHLNSQHPA